MVLGNRTNDQTDGIDPLQNVEIIVTTIWKEQKNMQNSGAMELNKKVGVHFNHH